MGILEGKLPRRYASRLEAAHARLDLLSAAARKQNPRPETQLYPHTVWYLHAGELLQGRSLGQSVRRGAWAYYFKRGRTMACALLEIAPGRRESISFTEGPFVAQIVRLMERAGRDARLRGKKAELRVLLAPSVHAAFLWLRAGRGAEHFVVASRGREVLKFGRWLNRAELEGALRERAGCARESKAQMERTLGKLRAARGRPD